MSTISTLLLVFACCTLAQTVPSSARTELEKGVQAYSQAKYDKAIDHFRHALDLEPELVNARLYLANAYAQQYVPGLNSPTNLQVAQAAISSYARVLENNPTRDQKLTALRALAHLSLGMKEFETAKGYWRGVIRMVPREPDAYFSLAGIDWTQAYQRRMDARIKLGLKSNQPLVVQPLCIGVKKANAKAVDDGIQMLMEALKLRPEYDDAMAYMNLLYRERADIQCGDPQAAAADTRTAERWVDLTISAKNSKSRSHKLRR